MSWYFKCFQDMCQALSFLMTNWIIEYIDSWDWVVTMSLDISSKLLMLPWFNELIHFDIEKDWFDLSRVRNPQIDYDLINEKEI